ncbi:hypothetical protein DYH09_33390 [bacterium CPR1]|nr:hypothetical protein [bacterium CPR1]
MKSSLLGAVLASALWLGALAQTAEEKVQVLALPVQIAGDYRPVQADRFQKLLEEDVEKLAPNADMIWVDPKDPRLSGLDLSFSMDPDQVAALGQKLKVPLVVWISVAFEKESKLVSGAGDLNPNQSNPAGVQTSNPYRYVVTVGGLGHLQVVDVEKQTALIDGPVALFRSDVTQHPDDGEGFGGLEEELAAQSTDELAERIVKVAQKFVRAAQP